jgi:hypothetical protein
MRKLFAIAVVVITACSCGRGGHVDGSSDVTTDDVADMHIDLDIPDTGDIDDFDPGSDPDIPDIDVTGDDAEMDALADPDCVELDQEVEGLETLSLTPLPASTRTPKDCGPNCRQVTFAEDSLWSRSYDVFGNKLVPRQASKVG